MEGNRELSTPSLPPPTTKSLTNMGTHLVVARNPASNSHHGQIHGERIRWKATENCPLHPYPTTTNKSLTAVGTHLVVTGNQASDSHHGQIHGEGNDGRQQRTVHPIPTRQSLWQAWVPTLLLPEIQPATATMVRYMEKELGRKAAQEMNIPVLSSMNHNISRAMLEPTNWFTVLDVKKNQDTTKTIRIFFRQRKP